MKKIFLLIFMFLILSTTDCSAISFEESRLHTPKSLDQIVQEPTVIDYNISKQFLSQVVFAPVTIGLTIMYSVITLIFIHLLKNNKNDNLVIRYKILILIFTLILYITFSNFIRGYYNFFTITIVLALIEIFLGMLPPKNSTRFILTLVPALILVCIFLLTTHSYPSFEDPTHEMFHMMEKLTNFFLIVIWPVIISQLALIPLYFYYKKKKN